MKYIFSDEKIDLLFTNKEYWFISATSFLSRRPMEIWNLHKGTPKQENCT